jgi:hypothetical protein
MGLVSSCGNHVGNARSSQCSAGKIAVNRGSTEDQVLCIEWVATGEKSKQPIKNRRMLGFPL